MKAYLDNQIIVGIEQFKLSTSSIIEHVNSEIRSFPFSPVHIWEADAYEGNTPQDRKEFLEDRLIALQAISNHEYLYYDPRHKTVQRLERTPQEVMADIDSGKDLAKPAMKGLVNLLSEDVKSNLRKTLPITSRELNNLSASELIKQSAYILSHWGFTGSLKDWIEHSVSFHPNGAEFGVYQRFPAIFELLDLMGYWKDEYKETSNYARHWDAQHAFFAGHCDYLVSDDRRMRKKAQVAYALYGFNTKIVDSKGNVEP